MMTFEKREIDMVDLRTLYRVSLSVIGRCEVFRRNNGKVKKSSSIWEHKQ